MRIGCSTISFAPLTTEEAFQTIADLGFTVVDVAAVPKIFEHVQLVDPPEGHVEHVASLVEKFGFTVSGLQSVPWIPDALDNPDELKKRYTIAADAAVAVKASCWIVDSNACPPEDQGGRQKGLDRWKRTIDMAGELAKDRGLRLGIEAPHAGTLAETVPQALELLELSGNPELGIDYDCSHIVGADCSVEDSIAALGDRIVHIAIRDGVGPRQFRQPGEGVYDFHALIRELRRIDYKGDLTLELEPPQGATIEDRVRNAEQGKVFMEKVLAEA